jgi:AraC-like DNA-binding protein
LDVIRWGKRSGKQRYKCRQCGLLYTHNNVAVSKSNRFAWFKLWVAGRQTIRQLQKVSGYSERTLKRYFYQYLTTAPIFTVKPSEKVNLLIDATYFKGNLCLVLYRDNTIKYTQLYRLTDGEWYEEIKEDLQNLLTLGVQIQSITCDGHKALLKAISSVCPDIFLQRCLVHIQRMCRIWLTMRPKSEAGVALRFIVNGLHRINNHQQRDYWIVSLAKWHQQYEGYLKEKSYSHQTGRYWYKHRMVRRSFTVIKKALPHMFHYLDNERIPKSTNGLESFFGHLKSHITLHRGLSKQHRKNFIKWYLYFRNTF